MNKVKGQAALEFLTTYGWSVLVLLVMIAVLAQFGVLSPATFIPDRCDTSGEFECDIPQIYADGSFMLTLKYRGDGDIGSLQNFTARRGDLVFSDLNCSMGSDPKGVGRNKATDFSVPSGFDQVYVLCSVPSDEFVSAVGGKTEFLVSFDYAKRGRRILSSASMDLVGTTAGYHPSDNSPQCYNSSNVNTVGEWFGCYGMLIVDRSSLESAGLIEGGVDRAVVHEGVYYSFGEGGDGDIFTGQVTDMSFLFSGDSDFNGDIGYWDVSSVVDMSSMFEYADSFDRDLSGWDVSSVVDMSSMFEYADSFDQDLSGWDVSNVTSMYGLFWGAYSFNQDLSGWDVSGVSDMGAMFRGAYSFNQDIGGWDTSSVVDMTGMFYNSGFDNGGIDSINEWNVSNVVSMGGSFNGMFAGTPFNRPISAWDVSKVEIMYGMFWNSDFNQDIGGWNVSSVTNYGMRFMFYQASEFDQDLSGWCVAEFSSSPTYFASGSGMDSADLPVWGTCP